jgi:hypothetical protein
VIKNEKLFLWNNLGIYNLSSIHLAATEFPVWYNVKKLNGWTQELFEPGVLLNLFLQ